MRIVISAAILGLVLVNTDADQEGSVKPDPIVSQVFADSAQKVDPFIVGNEITPEHLAHWNAQRKRYLECPDCEASQPFPGE